MAASSSRRPIRNEIGYLDMTSVEKGKRFVCLNFVSDYIPGVLVLPKEFGLLHGENIPKKLLIHVPPGIVWNGTYSKERNWIEDLDKIMIYYAIKPYHLILMKYVGGPSFNIQIFNPYGVEINYSISSEPKSSMCMDRSFFDFSDIEVDKLCGTMACNAYNSGHRLYNLVIQKKHLGKKVHYKIFKKKACTKLGLVESMNFLKLTFKSLTWIVKLKWINGKLYMDKKWYDFAKAGKFMEGDICVFQQTSNLQKFAVSVYERNIELKCNIKGIGHESRVMSWFKIVNEVLLYTGKLEIPQAFMELAPATLNDDVNLITSDGKSYIVQFCLRKHSLHGFSNLLRSHSVQVKDVLVFTYVSESTFSVNVFKASGMEVYDIVEDVGMPSEQINRGVEETVLMPDGNAEEEEDALAVYNANVGVHNTVAEGAGDAENNLSFRITLKSSHVDKRGHGVYFPKTLFPIYKIWKKSTTVTLLYGTDVHYVSALRRSNMCRFGIGWTEFTIANNWVAGQTLQFDYVAERTFYVSVVG